MCQVVIRWYWSSFLASFSWCENWWWPPFTPSTNEKFLLLTELPNMNVATRVESVWSASRRMSSIRRTCSAWFIDRSRSAARVVVVEVDPAAEGRDVLAGLGVVDVAGAAVAGLEGDPLLDGADRVEVLVELAAVVLADPVAQGAGVVGRPGRGRSGRRRAAGAPCRRSERNSRSKASLGLISRATGVVGLDQEMCEP